MKKAKILIAAILCLTMVFAFVGCGPTEEVKPAADVIVNNVKTLNAAMTAVYTKTDASVVSFIGSLRSKFKLVDDDFTVAELLKLFTTKSYGVTAIDEDGNGTTDSIKLAYGVWPDITNKELPVNATMQWVVRDASMAIVSDMTASVVDNAEYYYSYEKIENPDAFTADKLTVIAESDNKNDFYINEVSTKIVKATIKATKADKTLETLFSGTISYTDDDLTFEEVVKAACDKKGIAYSITGGFINSIGTYANDFTAGFTYWRGGFKVGEAELGNYSGIHVIGMGDGAEIFLIYK